MRATAQASPPLAVASSRSARPAGTASPAPGCCRSGPCASCRCAVARSRNAGIYRPLAAISRGPLERGRRHQREPQAAVGAEALLRREVVDVGLGRVDRQPAGARGRVDQHQRAGVGPGRPGGSGMATPVEVSLCGQRVGVDAGLGREVPGALPGGRGDDRRLAQERRGRRGLGELRAELAEDQVLRRRSGSGRTPRRPRTRWCRRCRARPRSRRAGANSAVGARPDPLDQGADRRLAVRGAQERRRRARPARRAARAGPWTARSRTGRPRA